MTNSDAALVLSVSDDIMDSVAITYIMMIEHWVSASLRCGCKFKLISVSACEVPSERERVQILVCLLSRLPLINVVTSHCIKP